MSAIPVPPTWLDAYFTSGYTQIKVGSTLFPSAKLLELVGGVSGADDPSNGGTLVTIASGATFTATTASFVQPASGSNVTVPVTSTAFLVAGLDIFIQGGGYYSVASVTDGTHFVATNLGTTGNASPGATIPSAALVIPSGPNNVSSAGYGAPIVSSGGTLVLTNLNRWGLFIAGDTVTIPAAPTAGLDFLLTHDQIRSLTTLADVPVTIQRGGGAYVIMQPDGHKTGGGVPVTASSVNGFTDGANYRFAFDGASPGVLRCISSLPSP